MNTTHYIIVIFALSVTPLSDGNIFAQAKEPLDFAESEIGSGNPGLDFKIHYTHLCRCVCLACVRETDTGAGAKNLSETGGALILHFRGNVIVYRR